MSTLVATIEKFKIKFLFLKKYAFSRNFKLSVVLEKGWPLKNYSRKELANALQWSKEYTYMGIFVKKDKSKCSN